MITVIVKRYVQTVIFCCNMCLVELEHPSVWQNDEFVFIPILFGCIIAMTSRNSECFPLTTDIQ